MTKVSQDFRRSIEFVLHRFREAGDFPKAVETISNLCEMEFESMKGKAAILIATRSNARKKTPYDYNFAEHMEKVDAIFKGNQFSTYSRPALVLRLSQDYGVGKNKVEQSGGFLNYLERNGYVKRDEGGNFRLGPGPRAKPTPFRAPETGVENEPFA